jgi:O-antigen/teichoic acid export membrane protein
VFTFVTVLASGFLLIPIYKATGAALSLFLGSLVHSLVLFFMTQKIYKVNYRYIQSVIFVVVSVMTIFSLRNISNEIFFTLLISFICFLTLGYFAYLILMPRGAIRFIRKHLHV